MRCLLIALLVILCAGPHFAMAAPDASPEDMVEQNGLIHKAGEAAPFTGMVRDYHQSGKPRLEARYEAGKLVSSTVWYASGQKAEEVSVASDAWTIRRFGETGRLEQETVAHFKDGHKVSEQTKRWDESGMLRTEAGFEKGKLQGELREYSPAGQLLRDEVYDQGVLVKKLK